MVLKGMNMYLFPNFGIVCIVGLCLELGISSDSSSRCKSTLENLGIRGPFYVS